ncbi:hypothetical protein VCHA43P272_10514 [Vibrio chagasii]|nr:hypothetical protein VCHA42P256_10514 [Vibrio chagasii]CAH7062966.1 hypothetical protein VCHA43P272_10514 [Vibrio chagasii]CAH7194864.1 hypothetical protein VCHA55O507_20527 [Vibrio chagasii]
MAKSRDGLERRGRSDSGGLAPMVSLQKKTHDHGYQLAILH